MENQVMQQFTGTKTVKACKMNRVDAEQIIGRPIKGKSEEDEPGYLVQYPDGYTSWSPKQVFEYAYKISETHLDRMKIELAEVTKRWIDGRAFTVSFDFHKIGNYQQIKLKQQLDAMEEYIYILQERITHEEKIELEKGRAGNDGRCNHGIDPANQ